jgi:hypothetical protein
MLVVCCVSLSVCSCGMPDLTGMAVDKYFVSSFETGAFTQCEQSNKGYTDGQLFEAYPSPLCIPQVTPLLIAPPLLLFNEPHHQPYFTT